MKNTRGNIIPWRVQSKTPRDSPVCHMEWLRVEIDWKVPGNRLNLGISMKIQEIS